MNNFIDIVAYYTFINYHKDFITHFQYHTVHIEHYFTFNYTGHMEECNYYKLIIKMVTIVASLTAINNLQVQVTQKESNQGVSYHNSCLLREVET